MVRPYGSAKNGMKCETNESLAQIPNVFWAAGQIREPWLTRENEQDRLFGRSTYQELGLLVLTHSHFNPP